MLMDYGSIGWQDFCGGDIRNGARYTPILCSSSLSVFGERFRRKGIGFGHVTVDSRRTLCNTNLRGHTKVGRQIVLV